MKKLFLTVLLVVSSITIICSQNTTPAVLEVNGLIVGNKYTNAQLKASLGTPTREYSWTSDQGEGYEYQYGTTNQYDLFRYYTNEGLSDFSLNTPTFKLFNGRLKVGDNLSKVTLLGFGKLVSCGNKEYEFYLLNLDTPITIIVNSSSIITSIQFSMSI